MFFFTKVLNLDSSKSIDLIIISPIFDSYRGDLGSLNHLKVKPSNFLNLFS